MQDETIGETLHRVENQIWRKMDSIAAAYGITVGQHVILGYLIQHESQGDIFQRDIEAVFDVRRSSVSHVICLLEKREYVWRSGVDTDARLKKISITQKGRQIYRKVLSRLQEVEQSLDDVFVDEQERALFLDMLQRLSERIQLL